jgi:hypothetical protein
VLSIRYWQNARSLNQSFKGSDAKNKELLELNEKISKENESLKSQLSETANKKIPIVPIKNEEYLSFFGVNWDKDFNAHCPRCDFVLVGNNDHAYGESTATCNKCDFDEELKDEAGNVLSLATAKQLIKSKQDAKKKDLLAKEAQLKPLTPNPNLFFKRGR